jgi:hypothetical protein
MGARGTVVPALERQAGHDGKQCQSTLYTMRQRPGGEVVLKASILLLATCPAAPCATLHLLFWTQDAHRTHTGRAQDGHGRAHPACLACICPLFTSLTRHPSPAPPQVDHSPCRHHGSLFHRRPLLHATDRHVLRKCCTPDYCSPHCRCAFPSPACS